MKKSLFLPLFWLTAGMFPCFGQPVWRSLVLAGAESKIIKKATPSRFSVSLVGSLPVGNIATQNIRLSSLEMAAFASGTAAPLSEKLGGPFFIGNPSGQKTASIEIEGFARAMAGIRLGLRLDNRFEIQVGAQHFQGRWSGRFPVVVLPHQQDPPLPPKTLEGLLTASLSGVLAEANLACFFGKGTIRPFLKGGIRGLFSTQNELEATLAGVVLPLETTVAAATSSLLRGAGIRVGFLKNGFVEAGASFGKMTGGSRMPSIETGAGWKF